MLFKCLSNSKYFLLSSRNLSIRHFSKPKPTNYYGRREKLIYPAIPDSFKRLPKKILIKTRKGRNNLTSLPIPRHDFINFKSMGGNEILYNLENADLFRPSELVSSLIELAKRPHQQEFDWENHPWTQNAFSVLKRKLGLMTKTNVVQTCLIVDKLRIQEDEIWVNLEKNILKLLHKLNSRDMCLILFSFDKHSRGSFELYERIVTMLPLQTKYFKPSELTKVFNVLVKRNLGSERLFLEYIYLWIEKRLLSFTHADYLLNLKNLAQKQHTSDLIFWYDYFLPLMFTKWYTENEAKDLWEGLFLLKIKCPQIEIGTYLSFLENIIQQFKDLADSSETQAESASAEESSNLKMESQEAFSEGFDETETESSKEKTSTLGREKRRINREIGTKKERKERREKARAEKGKFKDGILRIKGEVPIGSNLGIFSTKIKERKDFGEWEGEDGEETKEQMLERVKKEADQNQHQKEEEQDQNSSTLATIKKRNQKQTKTTIKKKKK